MNKKSISFIVLSYKNALTIKKVIDGLLEFINTFNLDAEIRVIVCKDKDGQDDGTWEILKGFIPQSEGKIFCHLSNYLKMGEAFRLGVLKAEKDYVLLIPADGETMINSLKTFFNLEGVNQADFYTTYTLNSYIRPFFRQLTSWLFKTFCNLLLGLDFKYHNGITLYKKDDLLSIPLSIDGYAFNLEILYRLRKLNKTFLELPILINKTSETSSFKLRNVIPTLKEVFRIKFNL